MESTLVSQIGAMLSETGLAPEHLVLEITETVLMHDLEGTVVRLQELRRLGIRLSVDDFGTGYSSLAYLRELPIDELKLDRSFVTPMSGDSRAAAIVESTIGLAHSLGLIMVAEGVEDGETADRLARSGCDQAQGYFFSKALPPAQFDIWLREHSERVDAKRIASAVPAGAVE
jgi:EAL domain-containing protein (putative c-di-GMP-specific phosphodiesterase class I)